MKAYSFNKKKEKTISFVICLIILFSGNLLGKELKNYESRLVEIFKDPHLSNNTKIICSKDILFLLQMNNHRIVAVKNRKIIKQIGKIGNGKGELYYPEDFCIDDNGLFYVYDGGNHRIEIFDSEGSYLSEFNIDSRGWGLDVNSKGEVLIGQPELDSLISVYDHRGKKCKSIGSLLYPADIYGEEYKEFNKTYRLPMNRIRIVVDNNDNIWIAFLHAPLVLKYNKEGDMLIKKFLDIPDLEPLKKAVWKSPPPPEFGSINIDGIQLTMVIEDIAFNPENEQILLLLGDGRILALDSDANEQYIINAKFKEGSVRNLSVNKRGDIFLSIFLSPKCYKLIIEK